MDIYQILETAAVVVAIVVPPVLRTHGKVKRVLKAVEEILEAATGPERK